jgi:hypothetical protein
MRRIPIIIELLRYTTYLGLFFPYRLESNIKEKDDHQMLTNRPF